MAPVAETMTSGNVVPMETTVAPTMISGIRNRRASPVAPSTNQSPPLISSTRPSANNKMGTSITFLLQKIPKSQENRLR